MFIFPDLGNDLVCSRDPLERSRVLVVVADVVANRLLEISDRAKGTSADAPARNLGEPAFDLIEPRSTLAIGFTSRRPVRNEPLFDLRMFVRSIVVENEVHGQSGRSCGVNLVEETKELLMAMPRLALSDHLADSNIEGGE